MEVDVEIAYWVVAGPLSLLYLFAGGKKLTQSQQQLAPMMAWAGSTVPMRGVRAIGAVEVLGAIGLILPPLTGIAPVLALLAALGLLVLQVLAAGFHLSRRETADLWLNAVLVLLGGAAVWLATAV